MTNEGKERKIKTYYKLYWASLVTQTVKNLPAMQKTQVRFLGWEDPLEEKKIYKWCGNQSSRSWSHMCISVPLTFSSACPQILGILEGFIPLRV